MPDPVIQRQQPAHPVFGDRLSYTYQLGPSLRLRGDTPITISFRCSGCGDIAALRSMPLLEVLSGIRCQDCSLVYDIRVAYAGGVDIRRELDSFNADLSPGPSIHCNRCHMDDEERLIQCPDLNRHSEIYFCEPCAAVLRSEMIIRGHNWSPDNWLFKHVRGLEPGPTRMRVLYYGTELEINTPGNPVKHSTEFKKWLEKQGMDKYFYFKRDGSLSCGYEIVTHPMTDRARHKLINWREICAYLQDTGATSEQSGECGLHIHASRDAITNRDIAKLKYFFMANRIKIHKFSRRLNYRYCRIEPCEIKERIDSGWTGRNVLTVFPDDGDRYTAVNTHTGKGTVEFRVMRGTLDHKRLLAYFQFVDSLIMYVKASSVLAQEGPGSWAEYIRWIRQTSRYGHLDRYLIGERI